MSKRITISPAAAEEFRNRFMKNRESTKQNEAILPPNIVMVTGTNDPKCGAEPGKFHDKYDLVTVFEHLNEEQIDTICRAMWCMTVPGNLGRFVILTTEKSMWVERASLDAIHRSRISGYVQGMVDLYNKGKTWAVEGV
jgi:hypothetical protein